MLQFISLACNLWAINFVFFLSTCMFFNGGSSIKLEFKKTPKLQLKTIALFWDKATSAELPYPFINSANFICF